MRVKISSATTESNLESDGIKLRMCIFYSLEISILDTVQKNSHTCAQWGIYMYVHYIMIWNNKKQA